MLRQLKIESFSGLNYYCADRWLTIIITVFNFCIVFVIQRFLTKATMAST